MDITERIRMLAQPKGRVDCVLDTDTYNEIDDQFALAYILRSPEHLDLKAVYAAPFQNARADTPKMGMERSYEEILHILRLAGAEHIAAFKGSEGYLPDDCTPVDSPAARHLAALAEGYSSDHPLYVIAIGAITNVASALLLSPGIADKIVVVWLGGHARQWQVDDEFNLRQDVAAARAVFAAAPVVQLPCNGVVCELRTTRPELEYWLSGKNALADYLATNTISAAEAYGAGKPWSRVIWDIAPVAWIINDCERMCLSRLATTPVMQDNHFDSYPPENPPMRYVYKINRDRIFADLFAKLTK